jgi:outer membrane receptor for ferrienterochelin and colicins
MWSGFKPYLDLTAGFRYDNHNLYGNQFSGRAGATSNPVKMLNLKLLYGSAFKAPSPLLLYGVPHQVGDIIGNPDLKPQKVHTVEGQAILTPFKYLSASSGVSYNLLLDKAEFVQQGINRLAVNLSKVRSISWESELAAAYDEWIRGSIGFERQWTTREFEREGSAYLSYLIGDRNVIYPDYILRIGLTGRIPKVPIRAGVRLMYVAKRPSSEMNALENLSMYDLPSYTLLNATISTVGLTVVEGRETTLSVIGRNLTNRKVADPGFAGIDYPLAPLTVFIQLRQEL